jgi:hypothetical protein
MLGSELPKSKKALKRARAKARAAAAAAIDGAPAGRSEAVLEPESGPESKKALKRARAKARTAAAKATVDVVDNESEVEAAISASTTESAATATSARAKKRARAKANRKMKAAAAVAAIAHNKKVLLFQLTDDVLFQVASFLELKMTGRLALASRRLYVAASTAQKSCTYLASELVMPLLTSHQISTVGKRLEVSQLVDGPGNDKISLALKKALKPL